MPRVKGGSPGKPRSRSGSQWGKSALVYSLRIGCPEIVVNSEWRSGLLSRVSLRVFFSHACSLAEGSRCAEVASDGGTVCVDPLCCSLMRVAPKDSSGNDANRLRIPCYSKGTERASALQWGAAGMHTVGLPWR